MCGKPEEKEGRRFSAHDSSAYSNGSNAMMRQWCSYDGNNDDGVARAWCESDAENDVWEAESSHHAAASTARSIEEEEGKEKEEEAAKLQASTLLLPARVIENCAMRRSK